MNAGTLIGALVAAGSALATAAGPAQAGPAVRGQHPRMHRPAV